MPGGIPHFVLGTGNALCVGRHFYAKLIIRSSVIAIAQTFVLGGSLTNDDDLETRTLLFQLIVFWSNRLDKRDVDGGCFSLNATIIFLTSTLGAHIPDMSSEIELFDVLYLGIFVILSSAFDWRFYQGRKPPSALLKEMSNAVLHFHSLLHTFTQRFVLLLEGVPVALSYVFHRLLAEFAAAAVGFSKAVDEVNGEGSTDRGITDGIAATTFKAHVEGIVEGSYMKAFPYFSRCLEQGHPNFIWTGPKVQILPRTEDIVSVISIATNGELLDHPTHQIYPSDPNDEQPAPSDQRGEDGKRPPATDSAESSKENPKKRRLPLPPR